MKIKTKNFQDMVFQSIDYATYFDQVKMEFTDLVKQQEDNGIKDEKTIQKYIEENPAAILGVLPALPQSYGGCNYLTAPYEKL